MNKIFKVFIMGVFISPNSSLFCCCSYVSLEKSVEAHDSRKVGISWDFKQEVTMIENQIIDDIREIVRAPLNKKSYDLISFVDSKLSNKNMRNKRIIKILSKACQTTFSFYQEYELLNNDQSNNYCILKTHLWNIEKSLIS